MKAWIPDLASALWFHTEYVQSHRVTKRLTTQDVALLAFKGTSDSF